MLLGWKRAQKTCYSKKRWETIEKAWLAACRVLESDKCNVKSLKAYKCPLCNKFHLTSQE